MKKSRDQLDISSAGEILEKLGFKKDSPSGTQRAFLKHLVAQANQESSLSHKMPAKKSKTDKEEHNQLSFFDSKKLA